MQQAPGAGGGAGGCAGPAVAHAIGGSHGDPHEGRARRAQVRVPLTAFPVTYKYALVRAGGGTSLEVGENRLANPGRAGGEAGGRPPCLLVTDDGPLRRGAPWRGAALAAPVFALRTRRSVGAGEFADLKPLVDVCAAAGPGRTPTLPTCLCCPAGSTGCTVRPPVDRWACVRACARSLRMFHSKDQIFKNAQTLQAIMGCARFGCRPAHGAAAASQ